MPHQLDAYLLDSDGDPGAGTEVTVDRKGGPDWRHPGRLQRRRGSQGVETAADPENPRELSMGVRGQSFGPYRIGGGAYTGPLD